MFGRKSGQIQRKEEVIIIAFIVFNTRYKGKLSKVVSADKARELEHFLNNPPDDLTDEQSDFLLAIKKIYPGNPAQREPDTSHIIHPGITQGMTQALPVNDRD